MDPSPSSSAAASTLVRFGWRGAPEPGVGRVVSSHGDYYHLVADESEDEILARKKKSVFLRGGRPGEDAPPPPITGDFVRFRFNPHGESMITDVLPRFSHFERKDPTARRQAQTLAVNFDTLFLMMSLTENFSLARLGRYLDLAADIGEAETVVVLTKADLVSEAERAARLAELETVTGPAGVASVVVSSVTGEGLSAVRAYARAGRTVALIGSSGVGKSSLLNALAGEEWAATREIQDWSGKGRHTTTSRELALLKDGTMVVDTPGIREIGRLGETDERLEKGESTHRYRKRRGED